VNTRLGVTVVLPALLICAACAAGGAGLSVEAPMSRAAAAGDNGAAFLTIVNRTAAPDRLLSAASDVAQMVELHETLDEDGVMKMRPRPEGFEIPAGERVALAPGGKHIMLMGLVAPLEAGKTFDLTLNFERAGAVRVTVPIRNP
jgi:copper(I)-binding protein